LRVSAAASPSSNISAARVARFEEPRGRPAGLPDWPFGNGRPRARLLFLLFFAAKYQSSFLSFGHPAPVIGAPLRDMKH
jgi:hypothetical protein